MSNYTEAAAPCQYERGKILFLAEAHNFSSSHLCRRAVLCGGRRRPSAFDGEGQESPRHSCGGELCKQQEKSALAELSARLGRYAGGIPPAPLGRKPRGGRRRPSAFDGEGQESPRHSCGGELCKQQEKSALAELGRATGCLETVFFTCTTLNPLRCKGLRVQFAIYTAKLTSKSIPGNG